MYRTGNLCQRPAIAVHVPHWLSNLPLRYTYRTGFQTCHCGTRTTLAFKPIYRNWLSNHSKKRLNPPCHCGTCTALATFASDLPLRYTYRTGFQTCHCGTRTTLAFKPIYRNWLSNHSKKRLNPPCHCGTCTALANFASARPLRYTYRTGFQTCHCGTRTALAFKPAIAVHVLHWLSNLPLRYTYYTGFQTYLYQLGIAPF